jgi:hypothetical protein
MAVTFNLIQNPGPTGPSYLATSTTSLTIGAGIKTVVTQSGLAYSAGARIRLSSASGVTNWMEGVITSYSGTSMVVSADTTGGSGSHADWNINIAGTQGGQTPWTSNIDAAGYSLLGVVSIGVGTMSPSTLLSLGSSLSNTKFLVYDDGTDFFGLGAQSGQFRFHTGVSTGQAFVFFNAPAGSEVMRIQDNGNIGINTSSPTSKLHVTGLLVYANNAAAISGGLTAGAFYRNGADPDVVCVAH